MFDRCTSTEVVYSNEGLQALPQAPLVDGRSQIREGAPALLPDHCSPRHARKGWKLRSPSPHEYSPSQKAPESLPVRCGAMDQSCGSHI